MWILGNQEGQRIASNIKKFNSRAFRDGKGTIEQLALTIQKNTLRNKHFDQADKFFSDVRGAMEVSVIDQYHYNKNAKLSDKEISFFSLYMGVIKKSNGKLKHSDYSPSLIKGIVQNNLLSFIQRPFPMIFSSTHIEERFNERARKGLEYDGAEFKYSMQAGLMIATVIPEYMMKNDLSMTPVVVLDNDGLYIGYAEMHTQASYYPNEIVTSVGRNEEENSDPILIGLDPEVQIMPAWSPNSTITIKTFVGRKDLKPDQQELCGVFDDFLYLNETADASAQMRPKV